MTEERKCSKQTLRLLASLIERPTAWRHGYELASATSLKSGTLYPILMRLAERELLDAKWEAHEFGGRPPRHLYRLSGVGVGWARQMLRQREPRERLVTSHRGAT